MRLLTLAWVALLAVSPCALGQRAGLGPPHPLRHDAVVEIQPSGAWPPVTVRVEVADDPREHATGLMGRHLSGDGEGMLFVFAQAAPRAFWMHNTPDSLDLLFLDADLRVVAVIPRAEPMSDRILNPDVPAQYVIEVPAGFAERHGLGPGAQARVSQRDSMR